MAPDDLTRLPEPTVPADVTSVILARTARAAERGASQASTLVPNATDRRPTWAWTVVGFALGLGSLAYALVSAGSTIDLTSPRLGFTTDGLTATTEMGGPVALALALGLLLYLVGLFAPVSRTDLSRSPRSR